MDTNAGALCDSDILENTLRQIKSGAIPPRVISFLATELPALIERSAFLDCLELNSDPETLPPPKPKIKTKSKQPSQPQHDPTPFRAPRFPPEITDNIIRMAEDLDYSGSRDWWTFQRHLKVFSLVSKEWCELSRKILWSQPQVFTDEGSIKRYRDVLNASPHLAHYVTTIDFLSIESRWSPDTIRSYFRRAAGLIRQTLNCTSISLLHIALGETVRRRLFDALGALKMESATFDSSCWSSRHSLTISNDYPNVKALMKLLCRWTSLKSLSLTGYLHYPRLFSPELFPMHTIPRYSLNSLELIACEFETNALLWILGSQTVATLQRLEINHVTGLMPSDLELVLGFVAPSLKVLRLSITQDGWNSTIPESRRNFTPSIFSKLHQTEDIFISTDCNLPMPIIGSLGQLASLKVLELQCLNLVSDDISTFIGECVCPLKLFSVGGWGEVLGWANNSKYEIASQCNFKGIESTIDGWKFEEIEATWHGIGAEGIEICPDSWFVLERKGTS